MTKAVLSLQGINIPQNLKTPIYIAAAVLLAMLFYSTATRVMDVVLKILDRIEYTIRNMTLYELTISSAGLVIGLIVANLLSIPFIKLYVVGVPISIAINILFGCMGFAIASGKNNESLFGQKGKGKQSSLKLIDTSVIIDGRIVDVIRAGFLDGEFIVPNFVLEELRHIADSPDTVKRNRGRRGLDVLNILQKELDCNVRIENADVPEGAEVDTELLNIAKRLNASVLTIDYNLSKVASVQGVNVLNINELANAVKPIALPGEEMMVQVIKDGKENGQGIGYLEDGTMIVVDGGRRHIGENISVMVTSVLQTAAGRMIFAKPKYNTERLG
ncbi:MAG: TRAM domain-containing protein [Clostridiaceae bacterium]|nr:TRAM domain-containing protein [Clostridiaceae bacterium]